jgi:hypothetical protein
MDGESRATSSSLIGCPRALSCSTAAQRRQGRSGDGRPTDEQPRPSDRLGGRRQIPGSSAAARSLAPRGRSHNSALPLGDHEPTPSPIPGEQARCAECRIPETPAAERSATFMIRCSRRTPSTRVCATLLFRVRALHRCGAPGRVPARGEPTAMIERVNALSQSGGSRAAARERCFRWLLSIIRGRSFTTMAGSRT